MFTQLCFVSCLVACVLARPDRPPARFNGYQAPAPPQPTYSRPPPPPSPSYSQPKPKEEGMPFNYEYEVKDQYSGNDYSHKSESDGEVTKGEYRVLLPDGRTQIVTYTATDEEGFKAEVRYEGEASFPKPSASQNGNSYKPPPPQPPQPTYSKPPQNSYSGF